jgi:hypothetical protein
MWPLACKRTNLGDRLAVGLRTLTPPTKVRILVPQPKNQKAPLGPFCFPTINFSLIFEPETCSNTHNPNPVILSDNEYVGRAIREQPHCNYSRNLVDAVFHLQWVGY